MNTFAERLRYYMQKANMKQTELVEKTKINKSSISEYLSGNYEPKQRNIYKIAIALGVKPSQLMGIEDDNSSPTQHLPYPQLTPVKYKKFKVLGNIACGNPIEAIEKQEEYVETEFNIDADYVLQCQGDSMINARIFDGDYVFIKEQPEVENGEIAAVWMDGTVTLKRFYKHDDYIELRAENPTYKPIIIHETDFDSVHVIGKAVACQFFVRK